MVTPNEIKIALGMKLGVPELYLKREDLHPYGSHKGRSIPFMIDYYYHEGDRKFAITGSGNAALAAALFVQEQKLPIELDIYTGNHISQKKLSKLKDLADSNIRIFGKERPLQALNEAVQAGARSLRQSTDDIALIGYKSLAEELAEIKDLTAIFVANSSGTTAQALAHYFSSTHPSPEIHIVQTTSCHPMVDAFEHYDGQAELSTADAIVDITALRKNKLIPDIKKTGGFGWVASNDEIATAKNLIQKHAKLELTANGALSVAGLMKAIYSGWEHRGPVVCIVGGE